MKGSGKFFLMGLSAILSVNVFADEPPFSYFSDEVTGRKLIEAQNALQKKEYNTAVDIYQALAKEDDRIAEYQLAYAYLNHLGLDQDEEKAASWFDKAAAQNLPQALYASALFKYEGNAETKNVDEAVRMLKSAAAMHDTKSNYQLGEFSETGQAGFSKDSDTIIKYYTEAADQGFALAQLNLGLIYYLGEITDRNMTKAIQYLNLAAEQAIPKAEYLLGVIAYQAPGVQRNLKTSYAWFELAAKHGYVNAQYNLGLMIYNGWGVPVDQKKGLDLIRKAADADSAPAQFFLGFLNDEMNDPAHATEWYVKSANQADPRAEYALAYCYLLGRGVQSDPQKAFAWMNVSAKAGFSAAQYALASNFAEKAGIFVDHETSILWYMQAANQGFEKAQLALGKMLMKGEGMGKDPRMAYMWLSLATRSSDPGIQNEAETLEAELARQLQPDDIRAEKMQAEALASHFTSGMSL